MRRGLPVLLLALAASVGTLLAQTGPTTYLVPPKAIVDVLDAPPPSGVVVSPTRDVMALLPRRSMPSIAELAQPMLSLAGTRVNPVTNGPHRAPLGTGITLRSAGTATFRSVPADAR